MAKKQGPQPVQSTAWVNKDGTPALAFFQYMKSVDTLLLQLAANQLGPFPQAANDAAAALAGVPINGLYLNGSVVQARRT